MAFWRLEHPQETLALVDARCGLRKTYGELRKDVDEVMATFPPPYPKALLMLSAKNSYESLLVYLAALRSGHPLLLVDAALNREFFLPLVNIYEPDYLYDFSGGPGIPGYRRNSQSELPAWEREAKRGDSIYDRLALLLNTSGSTGSPKLVRLSRENLQANASSIASYLALTAEERAITSLPMSYSYGLSVINSHLHCGASIVLSDHGVLRREFWESLDSYGCTSFAGVPYTYRMLLDTGLLKQRGGNLRTLTQAGGALAPESIRQMYELSLERGFKFFVMYGQTEATARISYVPFTDLGRKIGSIGIAIPGGSLELDSTTGELIYSGPNVMLGYAESREDLVKGDELHGVLRTGDLARRDQEGFFYITGRLKRFLKLFGKRYNLDELERIVESHCAHSAACLGRDDRLVVAIESTHGNTAAVTSFLCNMFGLPRAVVEVRSMAQLPRNLRGKIDYSALQNWVEDLARSEKPPSELAGKATGS